MKKIVLSFLVCCIALSVSAQDKKEMLESIRTLQANQTTLSTQLLTITQSLGVLQAENATLKERLAKLEADLAAFRQQGGVSAPASGNKPASLQTTMDSIQAVWLAYFNSENPEEASQYVADVQRVKPLMMKYYAEVKDWEKPEYQWNPTRKFSLVKPNVYKLPDWEEYIIKTPQGYKIDWEAAVQYNTHTEAQMKAQPNRVFELRLNVKKTLDYVNDYWVEYTSFGELFINIYAKKTNPHIVRLDKWIKQESKPAIVRVKWVPGNDPHFELVEFVCEGWSKY